jgi:hypothetical protein
MRQDTKRRIFARVIFFGGLLLLLIGCAFLLGSLQDISKVSVLLAFLFIIIGSGSAFLAVKLNKRSLYLFFAAFFILTGFFLFLASLRILPIDIRQWWPLVSVFAGLALIPSGWHRYGVIKIRYMVPAVAFVVLGTGLLIFSLDVVTFSFKQFILNWWHLLVAISGLTLLLISMGTKNKNEDDAR